MRLFVAIDLNEELRAKISEIERAIQETGADVKLVEPENLHITLKFLGEVPEERVREVQDSVSKSIESVGEFKISIEGFGYFGSRNYIRTLWVDVKEGRERILEIMSKLSENLSRIRNEKRASSVHLTIGRVKSAKNKVPLLNKIEELKNVKVGELDVKEIKLKSSVLTKKGPIYSDVRAFEI